MNDFTLDEKRGSDMWRVLEEVNDRYNILGLDPVTAAFMKLQELVAVGIPEQDVLILASEGALFVCYLPWLAVLSGDAGIVEGGASYRPTPLFGFNSRGIYRIGPDWSRERLQI